MKSAVLLLGGGQLGLMMAEAGAQLALHVDRLDLRTDQIIPGTSGLRLPCDAEEILQNYPVISAELEHLPETPLVNQLLASDNWANRKAFENTAARHDEKRMLDRLQVPTSSWKFLQNAGDLSSAFEEIGSQLVVKVVSGGYDGRGQWMIDRAGQGEIPEEHFGALIAEQRINFDHEVSLVGARSVTGQKVYLPLARNIHHQGILRYSIAGCESDPKLQSQAEDMLEKILDDLDYVGVMAMECFVTDNGLLVNELAPRVHNSGHWSQLGAEHNQFALHLRALLELPLPRRQNYRPTLMLNLIGCGFEPGWLEIPGLQCHWYGKEPRPGRKVGHININLENGEPAQVCTSNLESMLDQEHQHVLREALDLIDKQSLLRG